MKKIVLLIVLLCGLIVSSEVSAERGVVAYFDEFPNNNIIILTPMGYTCGKVIGVAVGMNRGNYVVGALENYGYETIYDETMNATFDMLILAAYASYDYAVDWLRSQY